MSGAPSRARRKEAVNAARAAAYAARGDDSRGSNPFTEVRQRRIYERAYSEWEAIYEQLERLVAEMEDIYGAAEVTR